MEESSQYAVAASRDDAQAAVRKAEISDLARQVFEGIGRSGAVTVGHFLSLDGTRVLIPGGAFEDAYSGVHFYIDVQESDGAPCSVVRVSTSNRALSRDALIDGCGCFETVRGGKVDGVLSAIAEVSTRGKDAKRLVSDIVDACLVVDGAIVAAVAYDAGENPDVGWREFDFRPVLEQFGFGETAPVAAEYLNSEYGWPHEQVLAGYALPYNLQKIAESGVLDAVIAETGGGFGLHRLVRRRWFYCADIVGALQRRGFTNEQIAFVIRNDEDLFDALETRSTAEELCERIESSSFDPADVDRWNDYTAMETGPLAGFL